MWVAGCMAPAWDGLRVACPGAGAEVLSSQVRMRSPAPLATRGPSPSTAPQRVARWSHGGPCAGGLQLQLRRLQGCCPGQSPRLCHLLGLCGAGRACGCRRATEDSGSWSWHVCWSQLGLLPRRPLRPSAAPTATQGQAWDPWPPPTLHPLLSVCRSQFLCPVSASWRTWTKSVQETLGQSGEGGRRRDPATRSKGASYWRELDPLDALAPQLGLPTAPPARL